MAIHAPITGALLRAPISEDTRQAIETEIDRLIYLLDFTDGDPDLEPNGDELDGCSAAEDEFMHHGADGYPGCPISDPGEDEHDREWIDEREQDDCDAEPDDTLAKREQRTRIRLTRCTEIRRPRWSGGWYTDGWRLRYEPVTPRFPQLRRRTRAQSGRSNHGRR